MSRYIDAELAKKAVDIGNVADFIVEAMQYAIDDVPTADVEEVRHGKWLFVIGNCKEEMWMCDQCERCIRSERMEKDELIKRYPYCHCGAKMDGGKE